MDGAGGDRERESWLRGKSHSREGRGKRLGETTSFLRGKHGGKKGGRKSFLFSVTADILLSSLGRSASITGRAELTLPMSHKSPLPPVCMGVHLALMY